MATITATPPVTAAQFRTDFSDFSDANSYPDGMISYWLVVATLFVIPARWCSLFTLGVELFCAHNCVLEKQAQDGAAVGGWPGLSKGVITGETAGQVTVSYDATVAAEENGSHFNLTTYGIRFLHTARLMGAGPIQVGPGCGGFEGEGWGGPFGVPCAPDPCAPACAPAPCNDRAGIVPGVNDQEGGAYSGPNCMPSPTGFGS